MLLFVLELVFGGLAEAAGVAVPAAVPELDAPAVPAVATTPPAVALAPALTPLEA